MSEKKSFSELLADYAAVSGELAAYIGEQNPSTEEQQMMDRLIEIHAGLVGYAVRQSG